METKYFVGLDISADFFTVSYYSIDSKNFKTFDDIDNSKNGFDILLSKIESISKEKIDFLFCMESTGVYGESLAHFLYNAGFDLVVENPLKVKKAFGISNKKSDVIDSCRIAEYILRYQDKINLWLPKLEIIEQIRVLLVQREQLNKQKVANSNAKQALDRKHFRFDESINIYQNMIIILDKQIKGI